MTRAHLHLALLATASLVSPSSARADATAECAKAYEDAQSLRRQGKLLASKKQALYCAAESCPRVLNKDCGAWVVELDQQTPSLTFDVTGADGAPVTDVRVLIDGVVFAEGLDGRPLQVDPGPRLLRFEMPGMRPVEQKVLVQDADRRRRFTVRLERATHERPVPLSSWIFGAVSVATLVGGTYLLLNGLGQKSDLDQSGCAPRCDAGEVSSMTKSLAFGNVFLGIGVATGAAAAVSFVLRPEVASGSGGTGAAMLPTLQGTF